MQVTYVQFLEYDLLFLKGQCIGIVYTSETIYFYYVININHKLSNDIIMSIMIYGNGKK